MAWPCVNKECSESFFLRLSPGSAASYGWAGPHTLPPSLPSCTGWPGIPTSLTWHHGMACSQVSLPFVNRNVNRGDVVVQRHSLLYCQAVCRRDSCHLNSINNYYGSAGEKKEAWKVPGNVNGKYPTQKAKKQVPGGSGSHALRYRYPTATVHATNSTMYILWVHMYYVYLCTTGAYQHTKHKTTYY